MAWLVVGLGNPGPEYAQNRHNIGFLAVDHLVTQKGLSPRAFRSKFNSELLQIDLGGGGETVQLLKPMEYMNVSGGPVQRAMAFFRITPAQVIVVHDDIELELGRVKVKQGGGHGGHNGLRSISQAIGSDYLRVRGGVGRPSGGGFGRTSGGRVVGHVLGNFSPGEKTTLQTELGDMTDAIEAIVTQGVTHALNKFR
jgi:PTH1 family peptidyl-tRNA hydrolase